VSSLPTVGEQVIELVVWVGADAGEQVAEVGEGFDVLALAGCGQAGQDGPGSPALVAAVEEPVEDYPLEGCPRFASPSHKG
jgi:hypothetical protein